MAWYETKFFLPIYLFICLSIYLSIYLSICLAVYLYTGLPTFPRAMAIRVRALNNKNSMVQWQHKAPSWLGPTENF